MTLIWVKFENAALWIKIVLTIMCFLFSIGIVYFENGNYKTKIVDYRIEAGTVKYVFIPHKNNFIENSLVSIYYYHDRQKHLAAIGYVVNNEDGTFQVSIVKEYGDYLKQMNNNKKSHRSFYVTPVMKYLETMDLFRK